jgi:hypothetical protein
MANPLSLTALRAWMAQNLVHFSFKTVNSQVAPGGVRLGPDQALDLPYVSVRTLMSEGRSVGLDYMGDGRNGAPFKQFQQGLGEVPRDKGGPLQPDPEILALSVDMEARGAAFGTKGVSPRLRQILVPTADGNYVALSPLGSSGLSEKVTAHVQARRDARKAFYEAGGIASKTAPWLIPRAARFSIGGSNPQNVGGRMRSMIPVVAQRFPTSDPQARRGWRLYHRGFEPRLPFVAVRAYATWLRVHKEARLTWSLAHQTEEKDALASIWRSLEAQAQEARRLLSQESETFAEVEDHALLGSVWNQGWLWGDRGLEWKEAVGLWLTDRLANFRLGVTDEGQPLRIGLSQDDARRIRRMIQTEQLA